MESSEDGRLGGDTGGRGELPESTAALIDLAGRWMREAGLVGSLAGASLEFTFDQHSRVSGFFAKTRGGRRQLEPEPAP